MIQSHLMPLRPPYQIIAAGGRVGIQVATLIVVEESRDKNGHYAITTHSHPVVNYANKRQALTAKPPYRYKRNVLPNLYLEPEGAVWDKTEIRDIWVLGIEGAMKELNWADLVCILNNNDPDLGRELNSDRDLVELRFDIIKLMRAVRSLGLTLKGLKHDPAMFQVNYFDSLSCDDSEPAFLTVELRCQTLLFVPIADVETTAQLVFSGIKLFAEYLLQPNTVVSLDFPEKEYRDVEPYMQIHERVENLLLSFETKGEAYNNQLIKF